MKLTTVAVAVAAMFVSAHAVQARGHHHYRHHRLYMMQEGYTAHYETTPSQNFLANPFSVQNVAANRGRGHAGLGGRPAAWCGWEMRQLVGNDPGPSYNLARNWAHWGHSGPAGVGAVVVWRHHVGKIVGGENGNWVIQSGNDGHAVRTRARSIAGAIAIRWG